MKTVTAAQRLVEVLVAQGVSHVFCVPGESYLAVLDALADAQDKITVISCRHESAAANMAVAHGKLTGRPGICMVTRGPGATHASIGVHTAYQDSAPMILIIGQVARGQKGREAFQEVDFVSMFQSMSKWVGEVDLPDRMAEFVGRAFSTAVQGRPGPVVLTLPEDMLEEHVPAAATAISHRASAGLTDATLADIAGRLKCAQRPFVILGGSGWTGQALAGFAAWCEASSLPIALSFRRKDLIDNDHPCYAGDLGLGSDPKLLKRISEADLILTIGARLGENPSQAYKLFTRDETAKKLIHIHPDPEEIGKVWPVAVGAAADVASAAQSLAGIKLDGGSWQARRQDARADYEAFRKPVAVSGALNLSEVFHHLRQVMPDDAIICNGAGNYAAWLHRFYRHRQPFTQLAPTSGAMGFGFPAAIAAKLIRPGQDVVAVAGDGCFLMNGQELATAAQYDADILVIIVDNGSYGTIRMHQERDYPKRVIATNLRNPDFVQYAKSFGAWAMLVERTDQFPEALKAARAHRGISVLHLKTDLKDIAPGKQLSI